MLTQGPLPPPVPTPWEIARAGLAAADFVGRTAAVHAMTRLALADAGLRAATLAECRRVAGEDPDPWVAGTAARAIEALSDADAARPVWRALLTREDPVFSGRASFVLDDSCHAPMLRELLTYRTEPVFRRCVLRTLGRLQDAAALPLLVELAQDPALREDAVLGMGWLGLPEAAPTLEALVNDRTPASTPDERGCPMTVGQLAYDALLGLRQPTPRRREPFPPPVAIAPPVPVAVARDAGVRPDDAAVVPAGATRSALLVVAPLLLAVFEAPWVGGLLIVYLYRYGAKPLTPVVDGVASVLCLLPPGAGLAVGTAAVVRRCVRGPLAWGLWTAGMIACGVLAFLFGHEWMD